MPGDGFEPMLAVLKSAARCVEARPFHEDARRRAGFALEVAREVARAHMHAFCKRLDGEIGIEVIEYPSLQHRDRAIAIELRREMGAELRLASGAFEEKHQQARDRKRDVAPQIVLHQSEGEVHTRGYARRGVKPVVSQKNRIGLDPDRRVASRQFIAIGPVRHCAPTVQQAGFRQQENTGADPATRRTSPVARLSQSTQGWRLM